MKIFKKPLRKVKQVFLHCSASSNPAHDNVETITQWHLVRDFDCIGYHYLITKDGVLHKGRNIEVDPASQKEFKMVNKKKIGGNEGTISICLTGGGGKPPQDDFTQEQYKTLKVLCKEINEAYNSKITFHGHCEVSAKACPVFDYKSVLGLNKNGRL